MKKPQSTPRFPALVLILLSALLLGACAAQTTQTAPPTEAAAEPAADEPGWAVEPWDGYGLEIPLDGSSMEAWERSLVSVKAYSEPADYQLLLKAIDYLQVYDIGARGQKELLIKRLNGLTGYQVLARVGWRKPVPGESPAKPAARDANPIDAD